MAGGASASAPRGTSVDASLVRALPSAAALQSPAQLVAGSRAQGYKGLAITAADGSVISLRPGAEINGQAFPLSNGQLLRFDRVASVDVEQPWDGRVKLTLTNGQQLAATTGSHALSGSNEMGHYRDSMPEYGASTFCAEPARRGWPRRTHEPGRCRQHRLASRRRVHPMAKVNPSGGRDSDRTN